MSTLSTTPATHNAEPGVYDWMTRHEAVIEANRRLNPGLILVGDSAFHYWGGEPEHYIKRGKPSWDKYFVPYNPVNMGFGCDKTENALWRMRNGELDGISPEFVILHIGSNNLRRDPTDDIVAGITAVLDEIVSRLPKAKILLSAIFPRKEFNARIPSVNEAIAKMSAARNDPRIRFISPGDEAFLDENGDFRDELFLDGTHANEVGNDLLGAAFARELECFR